MPILQLNLARPALQQAPPHWSTLMIHRAATRSSRLLFLLTTGVYTAAGLFPFCWFQMYVLPVVIEVGLPVVSVPILFALDVSSAAPSYTGLANQNKPKQTKTNQTNQTNQNQPKQTKTSQNQQQKTKINQNKPKQNQSKPKANPKQTQSKPKANPKQTRSKPNTH